MSSLIEALKEYDLTENEAKIYVFLLEAGRSSANQIARETRIPRVEVYRVSRDLVSKGALNEYLGRPLLFEAIHPEKVLEVLMAPFEKKIQHLSENKVEICEQLISRMDVRSGTSDSRFFKLVRGATNIISKVEEMYDQAESNIDEMINGEGFIRSVERGLIDKLVDTSKRGVEVRLITEINTRTLKEIEAINDKILLKHSDDITCCMDLVDNRVMMMGVTYTPMMNLKEKVDLSTTHPNFITFSKAHFNTTWKKSIDSRTAIDSLKGKG